MSISVAWGGKNSEDKNNIGFFVRKLNIFESFKPSTLTPKRTSSVRAPSGYPQTHGPRCSHQTSEKKNERSGGFSGALYLRCGPGAWILAGLLQPASPSWQQSPCMLPHTWLRDKIIWDYKFIQACGRIDRIENLLGLAILAGDHQHHPGGFACKSLPQLHTL